MSISTSSEFKSMRKSRSLPHIALRHESGVSNATASTMISGHGSCSILDQMDLDLVGCNDHHHLHHHHRFDNNNPNVYHARNTHPHSNNHTGKYNKHNNNYFRHQQCENISYDARLVADLRQLLTLRQHYYPEGGWGYVILIITIFVQCVSGLHMSSGILIAAFIGQFHENLFTAGTISSLSIGVSLAISPITTAFCRKKSTRLCAVIGGLVFTLGLLFTSFAQKYHQVVFSYGIVVGLGVGMTRDCSTIMIAQYFKKKREFVEIFTVAASGLGIVYMSTILKKTIDSYGWRYGLQLVTLNVFITFFLGLFYRSAALYHPQRRAILHLKNQRRKVKDKNRQNNRTPFFDTKTLRSHTFRIILLSSSFAAFGIYIPIIRLAQTVKNDQLINAELPLQINLGIAWMIGAFIFGVLVIRNNAECRIARQYLCQVSLFMCAICLLIFTKIQANYEGYFIIVWTYGFFCGGYHYSLRVYLFERVRARNFSQAWSFLQCSQSIPVVVGINLAEFLNRHVFVSHKSGYLLGFFSVLIGSILLFLVDVHKRSISRHKHTRSNGSKHLCKLIDCPQHRKLSFTQEPDIEPVHNIGTLLLHSDVLGNQISEEFVMDPLEHENIIVPLDGAANDKAELTCISEEGIADMDFPDNAFDDICFAGDHITSCAKVEQYLMLSEFENNLNIEMCPAKNG